MACCQGQCCCLKCAGDRHGGGGKCCWCFGAALGIACFVAPAKLYHQSQPSDLANARQGRWGYPSYLPPIYMRPAHGLRHASMPEFIPPAGIKAVPVSCRLFRRRASGRRGVLRPVRYHTRSTQNLSRLRDFVRTIFCFCVATGGCIVFCVYMCGRPHSVPHDAAPSGGCCGFRQKRATANTTVPGTATTSTLL